MVGRSQLPEPSNDWSEPQAACKQRNFCPQKHQEQKVAPLQYDCPIKTKQHLRRTPLHPTCDYTVEAIPRKVFVPNSIDLVQGETNILQLEPRNVVCGRLLNAQPTPPSPMCAVEHRNRCLVSQRNRNGPAS